MINLKELQVFLAAAEYENFSQAGRKLHLSQPAVSQAVANLEKQFNVDLFIRAGRSYKLTESGKLLQSMSKELTASAIRLEEMMLSLQDDVIGHFVIGCSTASGKYLLPGLIAEFRKKFPHVRADILVSSRNSVIRRLLEGQAAIGVSSKKIDHRELEYHEFFNDEIILVVGKKHPWAGFRTIYPDDLLEEPVILREEAAGTTEVLFAGLQQHNITPDMLNIAMILGNAEAICMAVEEGIGVAFISRLAAGRSLELGSLVEVKVEKLRLKREIYMARNIKIPNTRAQSLFWEYVVERAPDLEAPTLAGLVS